MRLWSLHPKYLDRQGLTALWREALLAQKVLEGATRGYTKHSQLIRFRQTSAPLDYLRVYMHSIVDEAFNRDYSFDREKIGRIWGPLPQLEPMLVTNGQLQYEANHLERKLQTRSPERSIDMTKLIEPHPLFQVVTGDIASWEKR